MIICIFAPDLVIGKEDTPYDPFLMIGIDKGGEQLNRAEDNSSYNIKAGEGFYLLFGTERAFEFKNDFQWRSRVLTGYKVEKDEDDNGGDVDWRHFPVELHQFLYYKPYKIGLGLGVGKYLFTRLKGEKSRSPIDKKFDQTLGLVVTLEKIGPIKKGKRYLIYGIRYQKKEFIERSRRKTFDGESWGVFLGMIFAKF
jgi:hypothetical protein